MLRRSHSSIQQLDLQLQGNTGRSNDIVLLKGPPLEASSQSLQGEIVLNALDTMTVRKITLRLVGVMRLRWGSEPGQKPGTQMPVRYEKQLYQQEFSGFEIPGRLVSGSNSGSAYASHKATPSASLTNLASYFSSHKHKSSSREPSPSQSRINSTTNLNALGHQGDGSPTHAHQLPAGPHKFPFELVVPGELTESVEGNRHVQLSYWLHASVERGRLQQNLTAKKHVRVVRTLGIDSYDVAHTVSIENTWPKKVEYKITVPNKAAPIGSQLEVHFAMVPLDKGLKLGRIRAEIVEYVSITTPIANPREEEYVVAQQFFEVPANFDHLSDEWELLKMVDLPRSLARTTQDTTIPPYVKINHKFRCFISLINRDGHTSELRASLPITLYISPNVYVIGTSNDERPAKPSKHHSTASAEEPMFNVERQARPNQASLRSEDAAAPPTYSHHVFDRLYSTLPTPAESPTQSGAATPRFSPSSRANSPVSLANLDERQQAQLAAGLRALALSRQNSQQNLPQLQRNDSSNIDVRALSRVPSYDQAMSERAAPDAAPDYSD